MSKSKKSPFKTLAECVGTAIVSIAVVPALIIDAIISQ